MTDVNIKLMNMEDKTSFLRLSIGEWFRIVYPVLPDPPALARAIYVKTGTSTAVNVETGVVQQVPDTTVRRIKRVQIVAEE